MALLPLLLSMVSSFLFLPSMAELPRLEHPLKSDGSLSLLVIGDWGRKGTFNQTLIAAQMGRIGESLDIDFVISTWDNFYEEGLSGIDDYKKCQCTWSSRVSSESNSDFQFFFPASHPLETPSTSISLKEIMDDYLGLFSDSWSIENDVPSGESISSNSHDYTVEFTTDQAGSAHARLKGNSCTN
ncbi:uncharacterized protein LOC122043744 [Zingiber officinale]|uniref:uncharacterized protein LOC122043744 n=1 Tax=Zingiber officinale TaxID=94328 RepID=UPI001C4C2369|nr:uncharacterized protein LOC122043744 [Zingiber officinale]